MAELRVSMIPVTAKLAAALLADPVQVEEELCVAYAAPDPRTPDGAELAGWLRRSFPAKGGAVGDASTGGVLRIWLVKIVSEETIIGWISAATDRNVPGGVRFQLELSPSYCDVGYEEESWIAAIAAMKSVGTETRAK